MASPEDITASLKILDLGSSLQPRGSSTVAKAATFADNKLAAEIQTSESTTGKPNSLSRKRRGKKSLKSRSSATQTKKDPATILPALPKIEPKIVKQENLPNASQTKTQADFDALLASMPKAKTNPKDSTKVSKSPPILTPTGPRSKPLFDRESNKRNAGSSSQKSFRYVIQASIGTKSSEIIIGVYKSLEEATLKAEEFAEIWGVRKDKIIDIQSSMGCAAGVKRRTWPSGMSEIRVGRRWVKIFPYEVTILDEEQQEEYLALDESIGQFIVGVFLTKDAAWEACKKYRDQLAYCSKVEGQSQWVDEEGMFHSKGRIAGKAHHWFVMKYT